MILKINLYFNPFISEGILGDTHLKVHFFHDHLVEIACLQHTLGCVQGDWETLPPPEGILLGCQFVPYREIPNANPFLLDKNLKTREKDTEMFREINMLYNPFRGQIYLWESLLRTKFKVHILQLEDKSIICTPLNRGEKTLKGGILICAANIYKSYIFCPQVRP